VEQLCLPTDKGLTAVNYVDLEQYLYSVLGMNGNWPQEALKLKLSLPVPTPSKNEKNGIYDLGDTQASQVYKGVESESSGTHKAVNATDGHSRIGSSLSACHCSGGHRKCLVSIPALPAWRSRF